MTTFKITQPIIDEQGRITSTTEMFASFTEFLKECGYDGLGEISRIEEQANYIISIKNGDNTTPIEVIVGKKYMRLMNKRLSPTVTSQVTYEKDLEFKKYKTNIGAIISSVQGFADEDAKMVNIVNELLKVETDDQIKHYMIKYGIDGMSIVDNQIYLEKNVEGTAGITIKLDNSGGKFHFSVKYPKNELFGLLSNFLPENNYEPKMNGINGCIERYNMMAGEIIQKIINDEENKQ